MPILFLLFVVLPIAEIMVLINVSESIGGLNTFAIVIITAFFGAYFVRQQGFAVLQQVQTKFAQGQAPGNELAEGILLLIAGVLLVTPGFITDALGFLFTLPFSRTPIANFVIAQMAKKQGANVHFQYGGSPFEQHQSKRTNDQNDKGDIIDGEYTDTSDTQNDKNRLN